ncbi:hypothetical protein GCM10010515_41110 [Streptomyces fructofermentans]|uniref:STAS domain-containing protein n=1 Tax=Streptomyces fructofermentans TaxID=152141 RepID=A0A918KMZ1_9ACTN|nr:hypothetical protein GCM10010515_41110 [Streptomyces fructofermentans]
MPMGIPPILNVCRHDTVNRALVTLTGEIDLQSALSAYIPEERFPHDGIDTLDVRVTDVASCDHRGINAFLPALPRSTTAEGPSSTAPLERGVATPRPPHRRGLPLPRPSECLRREPTAIAAPSRAPGAHDSERPGSTMLNPEAPNVAGSQDRADVGGGRRAAEGATLLTPDLPLGLPTALRPADLDHHAWTRWSP